MRILVASWGSRGDVEPCAAVGRDLLRRGHEVRMAVPSEMVGFVESVGLKAVHYGLDVHSVQEANHNYMTCLLRNPWRIGDLRRRYREYWEVIAQSEEKMASVLTSLAEGSDLLITGQLFEGPAANVAEYCDIPLATLHTFPFRVSSQFLPFLPPPVARSATALNEWFDWRLAKRGQDVQRRQMGLMETKGPTSRRIIERGSLEIQAYDEACYPGLAAEWAQWSGQRPFVGALTMELATDTDDEVAAWIASGTPPIYFGFGSIAVESPADTMAMISGACAQLGERALVCSGWSEFSGVPHADHVKVVGAVNHAAVFPACRAVVHHGGSGTAAAALRAGVPQLILWTTSPDRPMWAARIKRLKVGTGRRLSRTTQESLVADLRTILAPQYAVCAGEIATQMTEPGASVTAAADLVETFVALQCAD